ncbi:MAG: anthranilate phosphoribosyltransferase, partial [Rhodospirillaceae bacterium]|nr:anthranilate phosphoribosyltransferase [Rhodospirillaceae bacterium]
DDIKCGDADANAKIMAAMLDGTPGPVCDIVLLNAAAALIVAGKVETLSDGVRTAGEAVDSGAARATLDKLIDITNRSS